MAITVNSKSNLSYRVATGVTTGNEVIFKVKSDAAYSIQGTPTSAGEAKVGGLLSSEEPTDFSDFYFDAGGSFSETFKVNSTKSDVYLGVDVISGTWDIYIREIK